MFQNHYKCFVVHKDAKKKHNYFAISTNCITFVLHKQK